MREGRNIDFKLQILTSICKIQLKPNIFNQLGLGVKQYKPQLHCKNKSGTRIKIQPSVILFQMMCSNSELSNFEYSHILQP